jgi:hypothetical protein
MAAVKELKMDSPPSKKELAAECLRELIIAEVDVFGRGKSLPDLEGLSARSEELFGVSVAPGTVRAAETILEDEKTLAKIKQGVSTKVIKVPTKRYGGWYSPLLAGRATDRAAEEVRAEEAEPTAPAPEVVEEVTDQEQQGPVTSAIGDLNHGMKMVGSGLRLDEPIRVKIDITGGDAVELVNQALAEALGTMADALHAAAAQIKAGQED